MRFAPLLFLGMLAGCNLSPFTLGGGGNNNGDGGIDGGDPTDGGDDGDGGIPDAEVPDACQPFPEGQSPQACDDADNDCDGEIDETFNKDIDPANCGTCGTRCIQPNASGTCVSGGCQYECLPGFVDTDNDLSNGCEYLCTPTNGGIEVCDFADNDCDEEIDELLGLDMDENNCGSCGNVCVALNAEPICDMSTCGFGACDAGFEDVSTAIPGCEYECADTDNDDMTPGPVITEECNGVDDDCEGNVDQTCADSVTDRPCVPGSANCVCTGVPGLGGICVDDGFGTVSGASCTPNGDGAGCDIGRCNYGAVSCSFGVEVCSGYVRPTVETCNAGAADEDEDCDGVLDNVEFNFDSNPLRCGSCLSCAQQIDAITPGASATVQTFACNTGDCSISACRPGRHNLDGNPDNGCEYACNPTGPETCDGVDNDCDGITDLGADGRVGGTGTNADDPSLTVPSAAAFCVTASECSTVEVVCGRDPATCPAGEGPVTFKCDYDADVEVDACGDLLTQEQLCNELDGDCDGPTDETFLDKGEYCSDEDGDPLTPTGTGACVRDGTFVCNAAQTGIACQFDADLAPGRCSVSTTTDCVTAADCPGGETCVLPAETCNNLDDDCSGVIDEDAPDDMVSVTVGAATVYVYKYEASKPDATQTLFGNATHRSCSKEGVMPWRNVTFTEASAACAAAGKRLCTETEWQTACGGPSGASFVTYPYGDPYEPESCNGRDVDLDCENPDSDEVAFTGRAFGDLNGGTLGCGDPSFVSECVSPSGAEDMSGNLREWTSTAVDSARRVRGGAYDNIAAGLTCDFAFLAFATDVALPNLGFRCCADSPD